METQKRKQNEKEKAERRMKIVAGLGSIDEYIPYVLAGADELFCGYVPYNWTKKYGTVLPLNRREVLAYNVQLGSFSELEILSAMIRKYRKPVHIAMNSLYYIPEQYEEIADIVKQCMKIGFDSFILADPALILYLRQKGISCKIHLSGEAGGNQSFPGNGNRPDHLPQEKYSCIDAADDRRCKYRKTGIRGLCIERIVSVHRSILQFPSL